MVDIAFYKPFLIKLKSHQITQKIMKLIEGVFWFCGQYDIFIQNKKNWKIYQTNIKRIKGIWTKDEKTKLIEIVEALQIKV